jgi:hypothetical protein
VHYLIIAFWALFDYCRVKSPVDGMNMDGIESLRIHHATDYIGEKNIMRWTEIFFIQVCF